MVRYQAYVWLAALSFFCFLTLYLLQPSSDDRDYDRRQDDVRQMREQVARLERLLAAEQSRIQRLSDDIHDLSARRQNLPRGSIGGWPEPIGVVVFACNRPQALKEHVEKLIRYRPSAEKFPIIISQDCDAPEVAEVARSFDDQVTYIKHPVLDPKLMNIPKGHAQYTTYYMIAQHYKRGLSYAFDTRGLSSVIITEDDLEIAPDFFEYFSATRWLLDADPTLYCVSAWNDNGKANLIDTSATSKLYRSDFFPGLGWMLSKELWKEFGPNWPTGFWDDWIREPVQRKNRSCIRPEVPRTSMTSYGYKGASKGLFFNKHLKLIIMNDHPVTFTGLSLSYLLKENYDMPFFDHVYSLPVLPSVDKVVEHVIDANRPDAPKSVRVEYKNMTDYTQLATRLHIMIDTKAGVPRTAYRGIVTCFINGIRIFLAPKNFNAWPGYDVMWQPPDEIEPPGQPGANE